MTKTNSFITSIIMIVVGALLVFLKSAVIGYVLTGIGVYFIVVGIINLVQRKGLIPAIIDFVLGAVIITGGWAFVVVILWILGGVLIVGGIVTLVKLIKGRYKGANVLATVAAYLVPSFYIVIGVCLFLTQGAIMDLMFFIVGIVILISGIFQLMDPPKSNKAKSQNEENN